MRNGMFGAANSRKIWSDLSFLGLDASILNKEGKHIICEQHSSLIVSGWDESKWAAFGFTNAKPGGDADVIDKAEGLEEEHPEDGKFTLVDDAPEEVDGVCDMCVADVGLEDQLACEGISGVILQEHPVWDPRLYFLQLTNFRLRTVRKEWTYLVCKIITSARNLVLHPISH